jgi:hypothetical protein
VWTIDDGRTSDGSAFTAAEPFIAGNAVWGGKGGTASGAVVGSIDTYDLRTGALRSSITSAAASASPAVTNQYTHMHFYVGAASGWGAITRDGSGGLSPRSASSGRPPSVAATCSPRPRAASSKPSTRPARAVPSNRISRPRSVARNGAPSSARR